MIKPKIGRLNWGKVYKNLPRLDLLAIQKDSYSWLLKEGIRNLLVEISPVEDFTGKNWQLSLGEHSLGKPKYSSKEALRKGVSFDAPLKVVATLLNKRIGKTTTEEVFFGDFPLMTERGTFIINGIERGVVNQIIRSPGAFFAGEVDRVSGRMLFSAELRPLRGAWLEFFVTRDNAIIVRIDRRRKFPVTSFLRAIGISTDEELMAAFNFPLGKEGERQFLLATLQKDPTKTKEEALIEIYQKMRPGEPAVLDNAQEMINEMFFQIRHYNLGKVGRFKINKRLGLNIANVPDNWILKKEDIVGVAQYLIKLQNGQGRVDDIDNLANRRLRQVGELVAENALRLGLLRLERSIKEKMSLVSTEEKVRPSALVNSRPVIAAVNEFFRSNQLSTILDQTNPLSELDNLRRISVMGPGGIQRERASFSIRDINASQYGKICPVRTPEGPNIGLVTYLALYCQVNEYGFLSAPYHPVEKARGKMKVGKAIVYLTADDEPEHYITHSMINIDDRGFIKDTLVPVRYNNEFLEAPVEKVEFIDICPQQIVGTAAALIPFLSHDMANRALMGTHMENQAVPLVNPESPVVGTGFEWLVPEATGWTVRVRNDGKIVYIDSGQVVVKLDKKTNLPETENIKVKDNQEIYSVTKFKRTNPYSTCYSQRPLVSVGQKVKKGEIIIDGPGCDNGEIALGKNLLVAYGSLDGYEYEDAIVISDRLVKEDVLTSINIEEYEATVVETKLGEEELTRDIPNVSEGDLANLAEDGIVVIGSEVGPNDILVGKIAPKGETELTAEERLLRAIFGEKAREVRDTSLRVPHGERGTVIDVQIFDREKGDELEPGVIKKVVVRVAQLRKVTVGDKLAGRHGNKGVISRIVPQADMPYLPDGTPVDIIISPLSVIARMNLGQLFEAHLGWAAAKRGYKVAIPVFEKIDEEVIIDQLRKANLPVNGKVILRSGRTGEPHKTASVVGVAYIMKLVHMVEDKTHARSTGPYSLVTQQPLGGKAQMGGQRLGEMEVWALEAHQAATTLQEMLTIKSDDVVGRAKTFEAIVKGVDIPQPLVPESFKVLVKELNSLCLEIIPTGVVEKAKLEVTEEELKEEKEVQEKAGQLAEALEAKQVIS